MPSKGRTLCLYRIELSNKLVSFLEPDQLPKDWRAVYRPGNLGDTVHNPHLFEKVVVLPDSQESEYVAKGCLTG